MRHKQYNINNYNRLPVDIKFQLSLANFK